MAIASNQEFTYLNHKQGFVDPVPLTSLPEDLLLNQRRPVLFIGEGNFSFTVAFAALREHRKKFLCEPLQNPKTWDGITSTRYEPAILTHPRPRMDEVKELCIESTLQRYRGSRADEEVSTRIEAITELPDWSHFWLYGIDACAIPCGLIRRGGVVWFQCPWDTNETDGLIREFLQRTADTIYHDYYVCIGITKQFPYVLDYDLQGILGFKLQAEDTPVLYRYKFLGANESLVKQALSFGYRHQGKCDIHEKILNDHVTLVFQRKISHHANYYS